MADYWHVFRRPDPLWTVLFADPIGILIFPILVKTRITPNQVTLASIVVGLGAAWMAGAGRLILAVALYHFAYVLDALDGRLAEVTGTTSAFGAALDMIGDRVRFLAIMLGFSWYFLPMDARLAVFVASIAGIYLLFGLNSVYLKPLGIGPAAIHKSPDTCHRFGDPYPPIGYFRRINSPFSLVELEMSLAIVAPIFVVLTGQAKIMFIFGLGAVFLLAVGAARKWVDAVKGRGQPS